MEFIEFKRLFQRRMKGVLESCGGSLYHVDVNKDELWAAYIEGFEEDIRQEFKCNCCRQFIKNYGGVVAIKDNKIQTLWDFEVGDGEYQRVVNRLHQLVKGSNLRDVFVTKQGKLGVDFNYEHEEGEEYPIKWNHLFYHLPSTLVMRGFESEDSKRGELRQQREVFDRALREISIEATETVLELIGQGSLYRGEEFKGMLSAFLTKQKEYSELGSPKEQDLYSWSSFRDSGAVARIRNSAIGTLLVNVSEGMDLEVAVGKYEAIMAPHNYRRPKAIITKSQVEAAERTIEELGLGGSLPRRYAVRDDISVSNVLFANRDSKGKGSLLGDIKGDIAVSVRELKRVQEVSLSEFTENIVPTAKSISVLLEGRHSKNLVSLIAPVNSDSPSLLKWANGFSWCYQDNLADSVIKERVKGAGGSVEGNLRISLGWYTFSDLDLHVMEPSGHHIYYSNKRSPTGGQLDVDMNAGCGDTRTPVENIIYGYDSLMVEGVYRVYVHNYHDRECTAEFGVELEFGGEIYTFDYSKVIRDGESVNVVEFRYSKERGIEIVNSIDCSAAALSKEVWGLKTNRFHKVSMIMYSPNHWEDCIGNKHVFLMLEGCENPGPVRGIFNEFIREDLHRNHKRVFEVLGSKMSVEGAKDQLSGLGFSTTSEGSFYCEVEGSFKRVLKVTI